MKRKKIGILTFHRVWNAGAFLQMVGLYDMLASQGHDVWIIDYIPKSHNPNLYSSFFGNPLFIANRLRRNYSKTKMAKIYSSHLGRFQLTRSVKKGESIEELNLDVVVSSADVWNYATRWSRDEWIFFGKHLDAQKLIGYAVSLGNSDPEKDSPPSEVIRNLPKYNAVLPRDFTTKKFALESGLTVRDCVLDAGYFLDINKYVHPTPGVPYLCVYALPNTLESETINEIKIFAKEKKLKIIAPAYFQPWVDENFVYIGPYEWLSFLCNADYVFTNTFHGTVFSIYLKKRFSVMLGSQIAMKTRDMVNQIGCEERIYSRAGDLRLNYESKPLYEEKLKDLISFSIKALLDEID